MICKILDSIKSRYHSQIYSRYQKRRFASCGYDVAIGEDCHFFPYENIHLGDHIYIGPGARFISSEASIYIGSYVMLGPEVAIVTGNHRINVIGMYMFDVKQKNPEDDMNVIIGDDVWVGMRAMLLKGVKIGRGSVIAAGAVVIEDVPDYSKYLGKGKIKPRFTEEEIIVHQTMLAAKSEANPMYTDNMSKSVWLK